MRKVSSTPVRKLWQKPRSPTAVDSNATHSVSSRIRIPSFHKSGLIAAKKSGQNFYANEDVNVHWAFLAANSQGETTNTSNIVSCAVWFTLDALRRRPRSLRDAHGVNAT